MTITNGYCTLDDLKQRLMNTSKRTASTISFTAATKTIADSASGLKHFQAGDYIQITGSLSNNGYFTVVTGNSPASFTVAESVVNESASLAVTIKNVGDQKDDASLESVIEAASRWIDSKTGTRFYTVAETRIYTACFGHMVEIDNLVTLTSLKTDPAGDGTFATTWAAADYRLAPYNAIVNGLPYTWIETRQGGAYSFPPASGYNNVIINYNADYPRHPQPLIQVVGAFGYAAAAPPAIKEACILASMRMWGRKDLVFGISGSAEMGTLTAITKLGSDGELQALLSTVKRRAIV